MIPLPSHGPPAYHPPPNAGIRQGADSISRSWYNTSGPATSGRYRLVHVPVPAAGFAFAVPAPRDSPGRQRRELPSPAPPRLVAKHEPAQQEHLAGAPKRRGVAKPPQHHKRDDVG